ncbi:hypothetical protein [Mycolicibacterium sp.]
MSTFTTRAAAFALAVFLAHAIRARRPKRWRYPDHMTINPQEK